MDPIRLNKMLENRVKDLAKRKPARSRVDHEERTRTDRDNLFKALGLYPTLPKTDLQPDITGIIEREGYRLEKLAYFSRPGVRVTAHLYLPLVEGKVPAVLCPHGHWQYKKSEPVVQAQAIGLALQGIAALVIDSPGYSWDKNEFNERQQMGTHDDPVLTMGLPVQGVYVWDLVRGLDYLETRPEIDTKRVGIAGASGGGTASVLAFAFDERISCAVPICYATSLEDNPHNGCWCNHLPGIALLGDRADWLALRAPAPVMIVGATDDPEFPAEGHRRTFEKLRAIYRHFGAEHRIRLELVEGQHDMNRRMRESALAFFSEHLQGGAPRSYVAERRPLTDGAHNPYPANTEPPESKELLVLTPYERSTTTFRKLLEKSLNEPYPLPFDAARRLVPWGKYGTLPSKKSETVLHISDDAQEGAIFLPATEIDQRLCVYCGISVPEFFAQLLHLTIPGGPEQWEDVAVVGDVVTSMIASMKTLVGGSNAAEKVIGIKATGAVASMTALHLQTLRPDVDIEISHKFASWREVAESGNATLIMPQARYLEWLQ